MTPDSRGDAATPERRTLADLRDTLDSIAISGRRRYVELEPEQAAALAGEIRELQAADYSITWHAGEQPQFAVLIDMGNVAMRTPDDVLDALEAVRKKIGAGMVADTVMDRNGNTVGRWVLKAPDVDPDDVAVARDALRPLTTESAPAHASRLRDATGGQLAFEPDSILEALANGDLEATDNTQLLARTELQHRARARRQ